MRLKSLPETLSVSLLLASMALGALVMHVTDHGTGAASLHQSE